MSKIVLLLGLLLYFSTTYAQHLSFMGIQLGQDEKVFVQSIKAKGFKFKKKVPLGDVYEGDFWKLMDCELFYFQGSNLATGFNYIESVHIIATKQNVPEVSPTLYKQLVSNMDSKYGKHYNVTDYISTYTSGYLWIKHGGYIVTQLDDGLEGLTISINYLDNSCHTAKEAKENFRKKERKPARPLKPRNYNADL